MGSTHIIDRRLNGKNKSAVNRERFLRRYRHHIKKAVAEAVKKRSITDVEHGESVSIPNRDIQEPMFHHGQGGRHDVVHPGNQEYIAGDTIPKPPEAGGQGQADGQASQEELRLLEMVRHSLDIDRLVAAGIERGARARHMPG